MTLKFFLPAGAVVVSDDTVRLSDGTHVPAWPMVAVPFERDRVAGTTSQSPARRLFVDAVTGALHETGSAPVQSGIEGGFSTSIDGSAFSRRVPVDALLRAVRNALPSLREEADSQTDPGFLDSAGDEVTPITFTLTGYAGTDVFPLGERDLGEYLVRRKIPQTLAGIDHAARDAVVSALGHVATNVVDPFAPDAVIESGWVSPAHYSGTPESRQGEAVRLEFPGLSNRDVYSLACAIAVGASHDAVYLDYRSGGLSAMVTVVSRRASQRRRLATRYEDKVVVPGRLVNADPSSLVSDATALPEDDLTDVWYDEADDYTALVSLLRTQPALFGGTTRASELLSAMGVSGSPLVSGTTGAVVGPSVASPAMRSALQSAVTCPDEVTDPKLFPVGSNPSLRRLSDVSQLDDTTTQDTVPFSLRANNPLKVKKIAGVTDLKTRFGYLGEAEGVAVYQDHVGGAAAGIAYLNTLGGRTMAGATRALAGESISRTSLASTDRGSDTTSQSAATLFSGVSQHVFGAADPTGILQQCATVKADDMESTIGYAAAVAKQLAALPTSPLTHDEWASAWQIARNEPNEHLSKSTTGATLPVTEETNTVDTGVQTAGQAKDTRGTTDTAKRGSAETWNPVSNYALYSSLWSHWVSGGQLAYQQKTGATDTSTKMAKASDTETLSQDAKHPTSTTTLPWTVRSA